MSKHKPLITLEGSDVPGLILANGETVTKRILSVNPCGSQVLVELLTYNEQNPSTVLTSGKFNKDEARHGWVRKLGPSVKTADWNFKAGDRVLINGTGTPVPKFGDSDREWVLLEPYTLKAVLEEGY
jgi:co-chaperonin GroES (HSP10)